MKYDRIVIAYHGCDAETAERLLRGEPFKKSQNDYDWLGEGIYLWEYRADRALRFAHDQRRSWTVTWLRSVSTGFSIAPRCGFGLGPRSSCPTARVSDRST